MSLARHCYAEMARRFQRLSLIAHAHSSLQWDQLTRAPPGGANARRASLRELQIAQYELLVNSKTAACVQVLEDVKSRDHDLSEQELIAAHEMVRSCKRAAAAPFSLINAKSAATAKAEANVFQLGSTNAWHSYMPLLRDVIRCSTDVGAALCRSFPDLSGPYSALLEESEPYVGRGTMDVLLNHLIDWLPRVAQEARRRAAARKPSAVRQPTHIIPIGMQLAILSDIAGVMGLERSCLRIDTITAQESMAGGNLVPSMIRGCVFSSMPGDSRIVARLSPNNFALGLHVTLHEIGHALYEQSLPNRLGTQFFGQPAVAIRSVGMTEGASALYAEYFPEHPLIKEAIVEVVTRHLQDRKLAELYAESIGPPFWECPPHFGFAGGMELSMLAHQVAMAHTEARLVDGELRVEQALAYVKDLLSRITGDSTISTESGVLFNPTWARGAFGTDPCYVFGDIYAAQLFHTLERSAEFEQASAPAEAVLAARSFLHERVWRHGSFVPTRELLVAATGEEIGVSHLMSRMERKLGLK